MKKVEKPNGKVTLPGTYAVDQDARAVYETVGENTGERISESEGKYDKIADYTARAGADRARYALRGGL